MNISIMGPKGAGKSEVSKILARKLGKKLVSTIEEIEARAKSSIEKLVKKHGVDKFMQMESEIIETISTFEDCVYDINDSVVLRNENMNNLKNNGIVIFLTADAKTLASRSKSEKKDNDISNEEIWKRYENAADYSIDTSNMTPEEVCDLIIHYMDSENA